jgi:hypothetical protein
VPRSARASTATVDLDDLRDVIERRAAYGERAQRLGSVYAGFMQDAIDAVDALREGASTITVTALDVALTLGDTPEAARLNRQHDPATAFVVDTASGIYAPAR